MLRLNRFLLDARSAARTLARDRAFAAFAVLLVGLGAGLLSTMFALLDAITLRKLEVPDPDSLFNIVALREGKESPFPYAIFERLSEDPDFADSLCATTNTYIPVTHDGRTEMVFAQFVTGDYYRTLHARPLLGRTLTSADDGPVAVISDAYWRRIGSDPAVIGKVIRAGSVPLTVVGVVPTSAELWRFAKTAVIVPLRIGMLLEGVPPEGVSRYKVLVTARLNRGIALAQAQRRLNALWPRLLSETIPPGNSLEEWTRSSGAQVRVLPGSRGLAWTDESLPRATAAMFVLAGLVSLAMCSNLAGLFLSRGVSRRKEYAIRLALGATRWDLVRRALAEVFVLSLFGGAAAILLSSWLTRLCAEVLMSGSPVSSLYFDYGVRVDGRVVVSALSAALATAVAAQIMPALRFSSVDVGDSFRLGLPTSSARFGSRKALLAVQVAAAMVLVTGSVLFARTLQLLARVDGGFRMEGVLIMELGGRVPWSEAEPEYFHELLRRVRAIPSVVAVGLADRVPMQWDHNIDGRITASHGGEIHEARSDSGCVWPGYFEALNIPVVAGRDFLESDRDTVVLTGELAHRLFPTVSPLGRYVRVGREDRARAYEVIGVGGDVRLRSPRQEETRAFFVPCRQVWNAPQTRYAMTLAIRALSERPGIESAVRREIEGLGKQVVFRVDSMEGLVQKATWNESVMATIATGFGFFTLVLTCAGLYALIDLTAAARRRELGIRMALGADGRAILRFMLKDAARVLGIGACVGLVVAVAVTRVYRSFLYGVAELEPALISTSAAIVLVFALAAALVPARRAARLDPGSVLRLDA